MSLNSKDTLPFFIDRPNCLHFGKCKPTLSDQWGGLNSKYKLDSKEYVEFWDYWCNSYNKVVSGLQQPLEGEIAVVFDIDLKMPFENYKNRSNINYDSIEYDNTNFFPNYQEFYGINRVKHLLQVIYQVLKNKLKKDGEHVYNTKCILLEKASRLDNGYVKNGFHLHFPFMFINKDDIRNILIPEIVNEIKKYNEGKDKNDRFFQGLYGDVDKIIDGNHLNNWFILGARKRGISPYTVRAQNSSNKCFFDLKSINKLNSDEGKFIVNHNNTKFKVVSVCREEFFKDLRYRYKQIDDNGEFNNISMDFYDDNNELSYKKIQYHLPRLLDMTGGGRSSGNCEKFLREVKKVYNVDKRNNVKYESKDINKKEAIQYDIHYIHDLALCTSDKRAEDYGKWRDMMFCIHNITKGHADGFKIFNEFSLKASGYNTHGDFKERLNMWRGIKNRINNSKKIGFGSLIYWAQRDDNVRYKQIRDKYSKSYLQRFIRINSHTECSKLLYNKSPHEYHCYDCERNKGWYKFDQEEHIWKKDPNARTVKMEFESIIKDLEKEMYSRMKTPDKSGKLPDDKTCKEIEKKFINLMKLMGTCPYRDNVIKSSAEYYYSETFNKNLNLNPKLIAFNNGVFDMENLCFRDGMPSDYLNSKLDIKFYKDLDDIEEECKLIYDYLDKIFTNKELLNYFLDYMAYVFEGGNHKNIAMFWTGVGSNGKSKTQEIIKAMLGCFHKDVSTSLITGKKAIASQARPELARCGNGVRLISMQEPGHNEVINCGALKSLTGNDHYYARDLYQSGNETKDIDPLFETTIICNRLPEIAHADPATARRIRVVEFSSSFKDKLICDTCLRKYRAKNIKLPRNCECIQSREDQIKHKIFYKDYRLSKKKHIYKLATGLGNILAHRYLKLEKYRINDTESGKGTYDVKETLEPRSIPYCVQEASNKYYNLNNNYQNFIDSYIIKIDDNDRCEDIGSIAITDIINKFREFLKDEYPNSTSSMSRTELKQKFVYLLGSIRNGRIDGYRFKTSREITNNDNSILGPINESSDSESSGSESDDTDELL